MTSSPTRHHQPGRRHQGAGNVVWRFFVRAARLVGLLIQGLLAAAVLVALLAVLPWALWHYIGWPLPDHIPTVDELQALLLSPMTTEFLLDVLACLCWITWTAFVIDVARCILAAVRGVRWPELHARGPVHTVAAVLVGVIVLSLLGNRGTATAATGLTDVTSGHGTVVAAAPAWSPAASARALPVVLVDRATRAAPPLPAQFHAAVPSQAAETVVVRAPENGIHDSLSRIAERTLGDSTRWPEIFQANKDKPQPGGGGFTNPNLIFPGEELALPSTASPATNPPISGGHDPTASTLPPPSSAVAPPVSSTPTPPATSATSVPSTGNAPPAPTTTPAPGRAARGEPGISWEPGVFVGLSLAAAISAALIVARRRYRRSYQPGSGRRDDLPVAPVVYQLRLAHLRAEHDNPEWDSDLADLDENGDGDTGPPAAAPALVIGDAHRSHADTGGNPHRRAVPGIGVRDGREVALDLAAARGLGLVGAGAPAAARALLLALLTAPTPRERAAAEVTVIIPVDDLALLLGQENIRAEWPAAVRVVSDLTAALDEVEAETLRRSREHNDAPDHDRAWPVTALVARPPAENTQRLQAVLDNGAHLGIVGVLLGQWRPGITAYIRHEGTVSSTSPGPGEALRGTRVFRMPEAETDDLLTLLHRAQSETPSVPPTGGAAPSPSEDTHTRDAESPEKPVAGNKPTTSEVTTDQAAGEGVDDTELEVTGITSAQPQVTVPRLVFDSARRMLEPAHHPNSDQHQAHPARDRQPAGTDPQPAVSTEDPAHEAGHSGLVARPITITVLGAPHIHWRPEPPVEDDAAEARDITGAFPPRQRELLVLLALHPEGVPRDTLVATLWEDHPPDRRTNALNTALSRLRRSLANATGGALSDITTVGEGRYQLDPALVEVDYWRFSDAVATRRAASTDEQRIAAYQSIVDRYGGCLADGMDAEWIDAAREAIRRDAIDAVAALARALVDSDPQYTLDLLETARAFDPHNELLYRDIMRLQERLGRLDAIPRTLTLLTTRLAEINDQPTEHAVGLATRLQQRQDNPTTDTGQAHRRAGPGENPRGNAAAS